MIPTTPPDEDFNWVIAAIMVVAMMIASANWWQFFHGGFPVSIKEKSND